MRPDRKPHLKIASLFKETRSEAAGFRALEGYCLSFHARQNWGTKT
jgi:hypothetical protein